MIRISDEVVETLLTLPRNEAGYSALIQIIKDAAEEADKQFTALARSAVVNSEARVSAIRAQGKVEAYKEFLDLLTRQLI